MMAEAQPGGVYLVRVITDDREHQIWAAAAAEELRVVLSHESTTLPPRLQELQETLDDQERNTSVGLSDSDRYVRRN